MTKLVLDRIGIGCPNVSLPPPWGRCHEVTDEGTNKPSAPASFEETIMKPNKKIPLPGGYFTKTEIALWGLSCAVILASALLFRAGDLYGYASWRRMRRRQGG